LRSLSGSGGPKERKSNISFHETIREKQTVVADKVWDNIDKTTGLPEGDEQHRVALLQWYLGLLLEFV